MVRQANNFGLDIPTESLQVMIEKGDILTRTPEKLSGRWTG
ncbi:MAG: hypothetical protein ACFFB5_02370 [Promethearchaeota archaeon]